MMKKTNTQLSPDRVMMQISKRKVWVCMVLSFVLPFYFIYWMGTIVKNVKLLKQDTSGCTREMLCLCFVPFYYIYWWFSRGAAVTEKVESFGCKPVANQIVYMLLAILTPPVIPMAIMQHQFNNQPYGVHMGAFSATAGRRFSNTAIYIALVLMTVIWLFPFFGILMESFRMESTAMKGYLFPTEFGLGNYIRLFKETDFLLWFRNTAIMGISTAVLQTFFVLSMSYVLSRLRFKGRKGLMNMMLILGMFPGFLTLILIYKVFVDLGLTLNMAPLGLIIVYCASSGMGYYVSKGFFDTIPKSLDEAARVDGATRWQVFSKVIMPLSKPIVIYTVLMGFMAPWGDFMMASYIIHENSQGMNVAVGVYEWLSRTNLNDKYTMFCAAGVIVALPVTLIFMFLQKYYVEGVTGGAVKG